MPVAVPPPAPDRSRGRPGRSGRDGRPGRRPSAPPLRPAAVAGLALLLALASLREPVTEAATAGAAAPDTALAVPLAVPAGAGMADRPDDGSLGSHGSLGTRDGASLLQPVSADDPLRSAALADDDSASLAEAEAGALALRLAGRLAGQITGGFIVQPFAAAPDARPAALPVLDTVLGDDQQQER